MPAPIVENMSAFFADFAVQAEFNGDTASVILDQNDEDVLQGQLQSTAYRMLYSATDFPTLAHGCAVTVDGAGFMVHTVSLLDDGAIKRALLYKP